ncbi:hypothetical protein [Streptomyces hygroscopicus]|uniref:hypothetical protein n=1 Tax=Streptomyces hygroscopicus TaxID=1912 RepID=UPI00133123C1|nr:hypothetical protein [Streptomyces hygroscopicus]MBW8093515.1 hypothetical protein [Streptomyces hygroscopicus subsp. hygroscopicus]
MSVQNLLTLLLALVTLAAVSAIAGLIGYNVAREGRSTHLRRYRTRQLRVFQRHDALHRAAGRPGPSPDVRQEYGGPADTFGRPGGLAAAGSHPGEDPRGGVAGGGLDAEADQLAEHPGIAACCVDLVEDAVAA